ncbi:DUF4384 domain-containing protein [Myxococcota bacterium]|nr:DUF4384 domain-containing protein [Myxococcota bacterium]
MKTASDVLDPRRDPMHPSKRALEEVAFAPTLATAELTAHLAECAACSAEVTALRAERAEFNRALPPRVFAAKLFERADAERTPPLTARLLAWLRPAVAVCAIGLGALTISRALTPAEDPAILLKGDTDVRLTVLVSRGGAAARPLAPSEALRAGDLLRFAVDAPKRGHVVVANLDARGRFSLYAPARPGETLVVEAGANQVLPGSIELDDFVGAERIFVLFSERPIDPAAVERALVDAYAGAKGDLAALPRPRLDAHVASVSITKVAP